MIRENHGATDLPILRDEIFFDRYIGVSRISLVTDLEELVMDNSNEFLIPNYYNDFKCKMGDCRASCCEGWPVTISLEDYFRLSGEECSDELRKRIDRGIKVSLHPTPTEYAQINHDYFGNCPMRLGDGRCGIHAEMGPNALAEICKLYPRGFRKLPSFECSCANSCEATLELLFSRDEPIAFLKQKLNVDFEIKLERTVNFDTKGKEQDIRLWLIRIIQRREYSLPVRLMNLGLALKELDDILKTKDDTRLNVLISMPYEMQNVDFEVDDEHLSYGLFTAEKLLQLIDERSDSVRTFGEQALKRFDSNQAFSCYKGEKKLFEQRIPKWEIWFEHMLVNHMFFEQFPYQDRPDSPWDEFVAICTVYTLLRFLGINWMAEKESISDFVDMCAAVFRLVDHTAFDRLASHLLRTLGCDTPQKVFDLIIL